MDERIDVDALIAATDLVQVVGHYVQLRKQGSEFVGQCVWHAPDEHPSMRVIPDKRFVYCHACGGHANAVGFLMHVEGLDFKAACSRLNGHAPVWTPKLVESHAERAKRERAATPRITSKPPPDAPTPKMALKELGEPSEIRPIRDLAGELLGYECRYPRDAEGKSASRVWTWGARGTDQPRWGCGVFTRPRPLYGLERLGGMPPTAPVIVSEGPKKADAAGQLLPGYASVSWTGGALSWHAHDWEPLRGRTVVVWPDADEVGVEAAGKVAAHLTLGLGCTVRVIDPAGQPDSWDAADALAEGWDAARLREWVRGRIRVWRPVQPAEPAVDAPQSRQDAPGCVPEAGGVGEPMAKPIVSPIVKPAAKPRPRLAVVEGAAVRKQADDGEPLPVALSDIALGEYFISTYGEDWRYVPPWGTWLRWEGDVWQEDRRSYVKHLAMGIVRAAAHWPEAASLSPDARRKLSGVARAGNCLAVAQVHPEVTATVDQWDTDPWLLGVPGGVVDLRTGELSPGRREDYIRMRCAVAPADPECAEAPHWQAFLERVQPDPEVRAYLRRLAGYCLTGLTREQCFAFFHGAGANGKGTFLRCVMGMLGQYAANADIATFTERQTQAHSTELARLNGMRLVSAEETDNNMRWAEGRIKKLTGEGRFTARKLYQDDFEFEPTFKLVFVGQHVPTLSRVNHAIKRRLHLVPWRVIVRPDEIDDNLDAKLRAEWPAILRWAIVGCLEWQLTKLQPPAAVLAASDQYLDEQDFIGQWVDQCCERGPEYRETSNRLAHEYRRWAENAGHPVLSQRALTEALLQRGFEPGRSSTARFIVGLRLRPLEDRMLEAPEPSGRYPE